LTSGSDNEVNTLLGEASIIGSQGNLECQVTSRGLIPNSHRQLEKGVASLMNVAAI
jgi:hypothetical protein